MRNPPSPKAILVHINFPHLDPHADVVEFEELVAAAGAEQLDRITATRRLPDPKYYFGSGKAEELAQAVKHHQADIIIFNHDLSPAQERNIERTCQCRVLSRTGLILDIFAKRAQTFEGKLQVELAQLQHLSTRLVRGWSHLERQKGGIGLRGPGETQLEVDRRLLRARIKIIHKRLEKVVTQREQGRRARKRAEIASVSLVGYTNAGKSTLFNKLSGAETFAADQLFATLDPTLRRIKVAGGQSVVIADTVGFIRHLPHDLVQAFRATLEEVISADLLLHVIDITDPMRHEHIREVETVLQQIGAETVPCLRVYNKVDCLPAAPEVVEYDNNGQPTRVSVSAVTGDGLAQLGQAISAKLFGDPVYGEITLAPEQGKLRALLYSKGVVLKESQDAHGNCQLSICMVHKDWAMLELDK